MRSFIALLFAGLVVPTAGAHGHGRCRGGLVGYGPVNPYKWMMTSELYTTDMAPSFREFRGGGIRAGAPVNSTEQRAQTPPTPRQGSKPSIVLPPPNPIANPQLTPPPVGAPSTSPPPGPIPASVKPSSAAGAGTGRGF